MSYFKWYKSGDQNYAVGRLFEGLSILLDLEDEETRLAIQNKDIKLLDHFLDILNNIDEIDAIQVFSHDFEGYFLQGRSWERVLKESTFSLLSSYKEKALLVIKSPMASKEIKEISGVFLRALDGDLPPYTPTEREIRNAKQDRYNSSRAKWLKLLIESHGYKCQRCGADKNLKIKHLVTINDGGNTELSNLELRCATHMN